MPSQDAAATIGTIADAASESRGGFLERQTVAGPAVAAYA